MKLIRSDMVNEDLLSDIIITLCTIFRKFPDPYFEEPPVQELGINFTDMNISRPILKVTQNS